jgi:hypothetical protein
LDATHKQLEPKEIIKFRSKNIKKIKISPGIEIHAVIPAPRRLIKRTVSSRPAWIT